MAQSIDQFGAVDVSVGALFASFDELRLAGVHRSNQSGIAGGALTGASSIVISGGYEDDEDYGDVLVYTGAGSRNGRGQVVSDQNETNRGNAALITSYMRGLPIRVVRGAKHSSVFAPSTGYRYDGLYRIDQYSRQVGISGFVILRFRMERLGDQEPLEALTAPYREPVFQTTTVSRRVRDSTLARRVKALYADRCQLCQLATPIGRGRTYSEGAHVRPLGRPHLGSDTLDNLLCLCPTHHVQLDFGGMYIRDGGLVVDPAERRLGVLVFHARHALSSSNSDYHRRLWTSVLP